MNLKHQHGVWTNLSRTILSVCQFAWDKEAVVRANFHELQCFCPALDDLSDAERNGLIRCFWSVALVRAVEDSAVDQSTAVVSADGTVRRWNSAAALFDDQILQTRLGDLHAFFGFVGFQELLAGFEVLRTLLGFLLHHLFTKSLEDFSNLFFCQG